ncbi:alpha-1,2-fucosyltransferase [Candidatus Pelagibacter sp.]|nr:alpha-1,2-fucosyltransferase [Candidatus Pelagibacter sp.]
MTIRIKLTGGLGNQMFQFAAGYSIAKKNNVKLSLDLRRFNRRQDHNGFELQKVFDIYSKVKFLNQPVNFRFANFKEILNNIDITFHTFNEPHFHYSNQILDIPKHSLLKGYWQSELYFKDYTHEIKKIFNFSKQFDEKNYLIANEINQNNSISIHVRRGDYLLRTNNNHNVDLKKYYLSAIEKTSIFFKNPKYFIFTDDPLWVTENFKIDYPFIVVDINHGTDSFYDMQLMSLCKSNIIANSSFSWWGAWLNDKEDKIIYAPKNWFNDKLICTDSLIPNSWNII